MLVYHYCDLNTFLKIVSNKTLRMSDVSKSNDLLECKALVQEIKNKTLEKMNELFVNFKGKLIYGVDNETALRHFTDVLFNKVIESSDKITLAICFSENGDLLSQWCQYANNGEGIAIGFDKDILKDLSKSKEASNHLKFKKISYWSKDNELIFNQIEKYASNFSSDFMDIIYTDFNRFFHEKDFGSYSIKLDIKNLFTDSAFIKNSSFQAEKEWRLLLEDDDLDKENDNWGESYNWKDRKGGFYELFPNGLDFSVRNNSIYSYIDLSFENYKSAIKEVIIGPNCQVSIDDIVQTMSFYQYSVSCHDFTVKKSNCPYVNR